MTRKWRSVIAVLLAVVLLLSAIPIATASAASTMTITVSTKNAMAGQTVDIDVMITGNPGVAAISLDVDYDKTNLELQGFVYNEEALAGASTTPYNASASVPCLFMVNGTQNINGDFRFATLTFKVKETAPNNIAAPITLSYDPDNIYDITEENIDCTVINGAINIIACVPGDINGDEKVNSKDVSRLMQYHAHWDVEVNEPALDTNGDGKLNSKDVTRLMQYLAHWDVVLYPIIPRPQDGLTAVSAKAPACEEEGNIAYWYDSASGKYYRDANGTEEISLGDTVIPATGHTVVIDPAVPATYESTGLTEGSHCAVCNKVLVPQEPYGPLVQNQYLIDYYIAGNDAYLASLAIQNPNPTYYTTDRGVDWLEDLIVPGYVFEGWFDGQGSAASRVTTIPAGTARNIKLYAKWTKEVYTITFDNSSMLLPSSTKQYTVDQKVTLDKPSVDRYVFLGWTTDSDELVSEIQPGTTGNFTLHSNWTSKRNLAKPVANLAAPIIIEDTIEGKMLFTYEIGQVENVPLYTIKNLPSAGGVVSVYTETTTRGISTTDAETVAKAIDHITTDSTSWTLSEDWNETTHIEDSVLEEHGYDRTTGQSFGKTSSNTFTLTTNEYDNTVVKANEGSVATTTQYNTKDVDARETWESKASLSVSDTESVKYTDSASVSAEVGVGYGPISAKMGASMETSSEISSTSTAGAAAETTIAHENTAHTKTGTDTVTVADNTKTTTSDKGWSKNSSSSSTNTSSFTQYEEETLSERIAKQYTYGQSYAKGGSNSSSADSSTSTGESNQYATTFTYFNSEETTEGVSYTLSGESDGSYRLVRAGIVHVFAVVIYDIANAQYSVATYSVLDDETYTYIDYSATSAAKFNDNENGVLPFEIPYFVNDYVNGRIVATEGLGFDESKLSTGQYEGTYTSVVVPEFISVDNQDTTRSAYAIRYLDAATFSGNSAIKSVALSNFIREIPASAFAGCSSLQFVLGSEIRSIGDNAFDGCVNLGPFKISSTIESIGENAFRGVDTIVVTASNKDVVLGAINSGAKKITINISAIAEEMSNTTLVIPDTVEYFELQGGRNVFSGLKVKSYAGTTVLNGITITDSVGIPLEISSESITLNQMMVSSPSFVMLLSGNAPTVSLYGTSKLVSASNNAVVCRNTTFNRINSNVSSKVEITGDLLYYGSLNNLALVSFPERGALVPISASDFEKYIKGVFTVTFDANGGVLNGEASKEIFADSVFGELPEPSREGFEFIGWYDGDTQITANSKFTDLEDITLRARWKSGWVAASSAPEGTDIDGEKWTYDLTSYTTSSSSSLSGWTQYDSSWVWSDYGSWTGWSRTNPGNSTETRQVESKTVTDQAAYTSYKYWIYRTSDGYGYGTQGYNTGSHGSCTIYDEININYQLDCVNSSLGLYGYYDSSKFSHSYDNQWFYSGSTYHSAVTHTEWRYRDRSKIYTYYYKKVENKEAAYDPTGQTNVSNVQKMVKYIVK
jgi:uncharacterized repeat protein (TIGR02543 family)